MGYYTAYFLEVSEADGSALEINAERDLIVLLREQNEEAEYCLADDGDCAEQGKWYDHEADLSAFSAVHSGVLFTLSGEGEESGDLWVKYFQDGKVQYEKANIRFAEFDPAKLKGGAK